MHKLLCIKFAILCRLESCNWLFGMYCIVMWYCMLMQYPSLGYKWTFLFPFPFHQHLLSSVHIVLYSWVPNSRLILNLWCNRVENITSRQLHFLVHKRKIQSPLTYFSGTNLDGFRTRFFSFFKDLFTASSFTIKDFFGFF